MDLRAPYSRSDVYEICRETDIRGKYGDITSVGDLRLCATIRLNTTRVLYEEMGKQWSPEPTTLTFLSREHRVTAVRVIARSFTDSGRGAVVDV